MSAGGWPSVRKKGEEIMGMNLVREKQILAWEVQGAGTPLKVKAMGPRAVSIANRWMLGWPERVRGLLEAGQYLVLLKVQVELEAQALADETSRSMAEYEILQAIGISPEPPLPVMRD